MADKVTLADVLQGKPPAELRSYPLPWYERAATALVGSRPVKAPLDALQNLAFWGQNLPTLQGIDAAGDPGQSYSPGPRESPNAYVDQSRQDMPMGPHELDALRAYLYGEKYADQNDLAGPR